MRTKLASVAVGVGVFLIVAGILVRFYAYPTLATVPANYEGTTALESKGAQIFNSDPDVLKTETWDLEIEAHTIADSGAKAPDGDAVWVSSTTVRRSDGSIFQQTRERSAFDGVSGEAVNCAKCDAWTEVAEGDRVATERKGLIFKFPFNTEKKSYNVWDGTIGEATKATFEGEEDLQGMTVYKFVQKIESQVVETREVPGKVFGSTEASVDAEMWYGMTRTFYVDPRTGSPINRVEDRVQELRYDGVSVPAFTGTVKYTQAEVDSQVKDTKSKSAMLGAARLSLPMFLMVLGLALLAAGLYFGRVGNRVRAAKADHRSPVGV